MQKKLYKQKKKQLKGLGANGYSITIDKDQLEDQLVHFHNDFQEGTNKGVIRSFTKLRGKTGDDLSRIVSNTGTQKQGFDLSTSIAH